MGIRVFLVDDEELLTESMEIILTVKGQMEVVGKAKDGKEALAQLEETEADIALVDLNMKGMGGIELIPRLKERFPAMKILVLTTFYDDAFITAAISGGADGYLLKDSSGDMIIRAIHQILSGQSILAGRVLESLSKMMNTYKKNPGNSQVNCNAQNGNDLSAKKNGDDRPVIKTQMPLDLTARELEICACLSKGCTNAEIAKELFLAEGTVKNYIMNIYDKFGIHDRAALVLLLNGQYNKSGST